MSIMFNQICSNKEVLPKYTYIYKQRSMDKLSKIYPIYAFVIMCRLREVRIYIGIQICVYIYIYDWISVCIYILLKYL